MTTTEPRTRRIRPDVDPSGVAKGVTNHPVLWVLHSGLAYFVLPVLVGPAFVFALAGVQLAGAGDLSGTALVLGLVGFGIGAGLSFVVGPRKRLFPPRGRSSGAGRMRRIIR